MIYLQLLWSFIQIGMFSIGGGYAAMPLIQNQVVDIHQWLTMSEFADVITIAEMTPGPIAVNSATFVGIQIAGFPGAVVATLGCIFPSCIIVLTLAFIYYRYRGLTVIQGILAGLRPAVIALIASAGISLIKLSIWNGNFSRAAVLDINWISLVIFTGALVVLRKWKLNPILVMTGAGAAGLVVYGLVGL